MPSIGQPGRTDKNTVAEIADGVDESDNVTQNSTVQGVAGNYVQGLPDFAVAGTSGGSIRTGSDGVTVNCSGTSGNRASVSGLGEVSLSSSAVIEVQIIFKPVQDPTGADFVVGPSITATNSFGSFLDLTNEQYVVDGTTATASHPSTSGFSTLTITVDGPAGETTFKLSGPVSETVTISDTPSAIRSGRVASESNGSIDKVIMLLSRTVIFND